MFWFPDLLNIVALTISRHFHMHTHLVLGTNKPIRRTMLAVVSAPTGIDGSLKPVERKTKYLVLASQHYILLVSL